MKKGSYIAAILLAVTMFMAGARAQDQNPGPPPSGPQDSSGPEAQNQGQPQGPGSDAQPSGPQGDMNVQQDAQQGAGAQDQDNTPPQDASDPSGNPKASVARVSLVQGEVSMQRGDSAGESSAVTPNTPLMQGDQILTGDKGRAEVQLDFANVLRLAGGSQAKIANLDSKRIQVQVGLGYANYSIFKGNEADVEIDTPNVAVRPLRPGRYRVQVMSDSETNIIVRDGEAEVTTPQGSTTVKEGELITIRGTDNPEYKVENAPPGDDWDKFNRDRDNSTQSAGSWQHTNRYYTGSNDLDANGHWIYVPGYGNVWQPYEQRADWAPYQDGRWVWEPYWGWTWVSYESWGWAPYHYGRWFYWNTGWVWWPGPVYPYYRPVWGPAFVTFFGFGGHVGFGFGFGSVGWLPCGPFDPFFPWYGRGFARVNVVVFNNFHEHGFHGHFVRPLGIAGRNPVFSNTHMALTNGRVRAGITSVSGADFARGGMGSRHFGVAEGQLREAHMMTANVPVVPTRESLHTGGSVRAGGSGMVQGGRFITRGRPASGPPAFHDQAAQMQHVIQNSGRTMGQPSNGNGRFGNGQFNNQALGRGAGSLSGSARSGAIDSGRVSMGSSGNGSGQVDANDHARGGWRSFGGGNNSSGPGGTGQGGFGNRANVGTNGGTLRNDRPAWSSGGGNSVKPQLQMAKPIVTPRTTYTPPAYSGSNTYNGQHSTAPVYSSPRSTGTYNSGAYNSGSYNSSRGYNSGGYNSSRGYSSSSTYNSGSSSHSYGGRSSSVYSGGGGNHGSSGGGSHSSYSGGGHSSGGSHSSSGGHSSSSGGHSHR